MEMQLLSLLILFYHLLQKNLVMIDKRTYIMNIKVYFIYQYYCIRFAMICESMVEHIQPKVFEEKFYPALKELSKDPVPNVRFIVARIFIQQLLGNG